MSKINVDDYLNSGVRELGNITQKMNEESLMWSMVIIIPILGEKIIKNGNQNKINLYRNLTLAFDKLVNSHELFKDGFND